MPQKKVKKRKQVNSSVDNSASQPSAKTTSRPYFRHILQTGQGPEKVARLFGVGENRIDSADIPAKASIQSELEGRQPTVSDFLYGQHSSIEKVGITNQGPHTGSHSAISRGLQRANTQEIEELEKILPTPMDARKTVEARIDKPEGKEQQLKDYENYHTVLRNAHQKAIEFHTTQEPDSTERTKGRNLRKVLVQKRVNAAPNATYGYQQKPPTRNDPRYEEWKPFIQGKGEGQATTVDGNVDLPSSTDYFPGTKNPIISSESRPEYEEYVKSSKTFFGNTLNKNKNL